MTLRTLWRRLAGPAPSLPGADLARFGHELAETRRRLDQVARQVGMLQGLVQQQSDLTIDALRRAGWQSDEEADQQVALQRTLRVIQTSGEVIAGPWTGEVGFEVLYWIPFLNWLVEQGLDRRRLVVVSRGGAASWYRHLTERYVDILDLITPADFRERTAGPKKQTTAQRDLDRELLVLARERLRLGDTHVVHPSAMYRLFAALWRKRATIGLVESFTSHRAFTPPDGRLNDVPPDYVAAKFYFSKAFPDTGANRRFVTDLLKRLSTRVPIVLMSTAVRLDEHVDFQTTGRSGLYVVDAHTVPQMNLEAQTRLICGSRGFIGTYGGFSYVAPFHGVRSLSFFSRRFGFEAHHLQLAERVFDTLLPGAFLALDRRAGELIEPAVDRWTASTAGTPAAHAGEDGEGVTPAVEAQGLTT